MFERWAGEEARSFVMLPPSGSYREYYRITGRTKSAMGAYNSDAKENEAFLEFSNHFKTKALPIPAIYETDTQNHVYLQEDLGDVTLYSFLQGIRKGPEFPEELLRFYKKTIQKLICFQINGGEGLNYNKCYPREAFDRQSMLWDLHYFKYYFLKLARVPFDEQALEDDYHKLINFLLEVKHDYFLYRDFQSRNVMVVNDEPWFIDYQGGRKGALQYDLASLLYDAKADIPNEVRKELLDYYIEELSNYQSVDKEDFICHYYGYVLIRIMQAMGAYGFRGFYEKKEHFLKSIPYAIENIKDLIENVNLGIELPTLFSALKNVTESEDLKNIGQRDSLLTVRITSFSYKRGIPVDVSGNGGGFVFDCRAIHNPGRYPEYADKTGKDEEVIAFFGKEPEMTEFLNDVYSIVDKSVEKYISRGFKNLMVNFGCTGGQHRSVFSAESLATYLQHKYKLNVELKHVEQEMKK
ncbi:phosphotransferase [Carboxylicivirga sp. A043]|uniref:RapZ C-terminal domain-containing protein n=1 Tax=Carboxylicivirga litoralis TaxID=2816963 RepID=UPI0021CB4D2B|nr:RNase adapter RapZ [Carboxylicivirga sp. A043]MCU4156745.1 phosphotransferase [Carboxylicivirga sp. A043]